MSEVRVRFAPSPTGHLHIGGLRSAIFNWLFARHNNGKFLIRVEDTDKERSTQEFKDSIEKSFDWMGIKSDEPVFNQTDRTQDHLKLVQKLIDEGKAYRCFCTRRGVEDIEAIQGAHYTKYDRTCLQREFTQEDLSRPHVVRFKIPDNMPEVFEFDDLIYGKVKFPMDQFDDFIILRSTGDPMYNFVVVADDIYQRITHVIRGQDHLVNTPKQIMLYQALGVEVPKFAHLPLILGPSGAKLSKREAAVSVISYKEDGFLPDALFNYLVRLGWSYGDQEIFSRQELETFFDLKDVNRSGAIFDIKKLLWLNSVYIKNLTSGQILEYVLKNLDFKFALNLSFDLDILYNLIDLYKDRSDNLIELISEIKNLDKVPQDFAQEDIKEFNNEDTVANLEFILQKFIELENWSEESIQNLIKTVCKEKNLKMPMLAKPLRLALIGKLNSPSIFALLNLIGKEEVLKRVKNFIEVMRI